MPLGPKRPRTGRQNADIPSTSVEAPFLCRQNVDEGRCNAPAVDRIVLDVVVFTKSVKVKLPVCAKHLAQLKENDDASTS